MSLFQCIHWWVKVWIKRLIKLNDKTFSFPFSVKFRLYFSAEPEKWGNICFSGKRKSFLHPQHHSGAFGKHPSTINLKSTFARHTFCRQILKRRSTQPPVWCSLHSEHTAQCINHNENTPQCHRAAPSSSVGCLTAHLSPPETDRLELKHTTCISFIYSSHFLLWLNNKTCQVQDFQIKQEGPVNRKPSEVPIKSGVFRRSLRMKKGAAAVSRRSAGMSGAWSSS